MRRLALVYLSHAYTGGRYIGVVVVLSFDAQPLPRKETRLVEGRTPYNALLAGALTLDVSGGS